MCMRYLIVSDVHANYEALLSLPRKGFDKKRFLGDAVGQRCAIKQFTIPLSIKNLQESQMNIQEAYLRQKTLLGLTI